MWKLIPTTTCHCYLKQKGDVQLKKVLKVSQTFDHQKQQLKIEYTFSL